jgi:hypothetical protein
MPSFDEADAVSAVIAHLRTHATTLELLGSPPSVSGILEGGWPHLIVTEGANGNLRNMIWEHDQEVTLQLVSHPNGTPGKAALRRQLLRLASVVVDLPNKTDWVPGDVIVSNVTTAGTAGFRPLSTGQLSYEVGLMVTVRPPLVS